MLDQRIQQQCFELADLINQSADVIATPVAAAAEAIAACITGGGKILVAGGDEGMRIAPVLSLAFTGRFERDRPPLAALALRDDAGADQAMQVRALGQPGDLLVVIDPAASPSVDEAIVAAHDNELAVIALTGAATQRWRDLLAETDIHIPIAHERPARVSETQLLVIHALCDAVDLLLMGEQEGS